MTIGSLDRPELAEPVSQDGVESRISYFDKLFGLPQNQTDRSDLPAGNAGIAASSRQHPDHDTVAWPLTRT